MVLVCVSCESGLYVYMADPGIFNCTCRIPAHLRCTQCSFLLHLMDICFLNVYGIYCKVKLVSVCLSDLDLSGHHPLYEEQHQPSNVSAWPAGPKPVNRAPIAGEGGFNTSL